MLNNQEVVQFVRPKIAGGMELGAICEQLMDRCLATDDSHAKGLDNMTVIIVGFLHGGTYADLQELCRRPPAEHVEVIASKVLQTPDSGNGMPPMRRVLLPRPTRR